MTSEGKREGATPVSVVRYYGPITDVGCMTMKSEHIHTYMMHG